MSLGKLNTVYGKQRGGGQAYLSGRPAKLSIIGDDDG